MAWGDLAQLTIAVAALWVSVVAIRRDRAELSVVRQDDAATTRLLTVVNVGLRPVRVERLVVRRWRFLGLQRGWIRPRGIAFKELGAPVLDLPQVVEPAGQLVLSYSEADFGDWVGGWNFEILVEDAAGHLFRPPLSTTRAPGIREW